MSDYDLGASDDLYDKIIPYGDNVSFYVYLKNMDTNRFVIIKSLLELTALQQNHDELILLDFSNKLSWLLYIGTPISCSVNPSVADEEIIKYTAVLTSIAKNDLGKIRSLDAFRPKDRIRFCAVDLTGNELKEIPEWISRCTSYLIVKDNLVEKFPDAIRYNSGLEVLDLSGNKISYVDRLTFFRENTRLRVLNLSHNEIQSLDFEVFNLLHLEELDLSFNKFDDEIYTMSPLYLRGNTKLKKLDLSFCGLQVMLLDLRKHKNLETLRLEGLRIQESDEQLGLFYGLDKLKELSLAYNEIYDLVPEISTCTSLVELDLSGNYLEFIPGEVVNLPKLEKLILTDNPITDEEKTHIKIMFADKNVDVVL